MSGFEGRVDGLKVDKPADFMPDHIIAKLGMHREKLIAFLMQQTDEWINVDICRAKVSKKYYGKQNIRSSQGSSQGGRSNFTPDIQQEEVVQEYIPDNFPDSPGPHDEGDVIDYNTEDYLDF